MATVYRMNRADRKWEIEVENSEALRRCDLCEEEGLAFLFRCADEGEPLACAACFEYGTGGSVDEFFAPEPGMAVEGSRARGGR